MQFCATKCLVYQTLKTWTRQQKSDYLFVLCFTLLSMTDSSSSPTKPGFPFLKLTPRLEIVYLRVPLSGRTVPLCSHCITLPYTFEESVLISSCVRRAGCQPAGELTGWRDLLNYTSSAVQGIWCLLCLSFSTSSSKPPSDFSPVVWECSAGLLQRPSKPVLCPVPPPPVVRGYSSTTMEKAIK